MIYEAPVNAEALAKGASLYRTRDAHPIRPRCVTCGTKVLLVRLKDGLTTCYSHDADDPIYVEKRGRYASRDKYTGPLTDGTKLGKLRKDVGLTKKELGALIGTSGSTIAAWETGKRGMPVSAYRACERVRELVRRGEKGDMDE